MAHPFAQILEEHLARYPGLEAQDLLKLAYQSARGPEHLISSPEAVLAGIRSERASLSGCSTPEAPEAIGGGLSRFPLSLLKDELDEALLARLFVLTAKEHRSLPLEDRLALVEELKGGLYRESAARYREAGCPAVSHSEGYRSRYRPHYRLLCREMACYFPVLSAVSHLLQEKGTALLSIDGRCGSGKTMLSQLISRVFDCNVLHIDDYYLPLARRQADWHAVPAANMDLARFREEALLPAREGRAIPYRPYSCQREEYLPETLLPPRDLTVAEGSYSQHPALSSLYDLRIFLTCTPQTQQARLQAREGDYFPMFRSHWIPLEEGYLRQHPIEAGCTLRVDTSSFFARPE